MFKNIPHSQRLLLMQNTAACLGKNSQISLFSNPRKSADLHTFDARWCNAIVESFFQFNLPFLVLSFTGSSWCWRSFKMSLDVIIYKHPIPNKHDFFKEHNYLFIKFTANYQKERFPTESVNLIKSLRNHWGCFNPPLQTITVRSLKCRLRS